MANNLKVDFPVYYDDEWSEIYDKNHNLVAEIRGWGRLQNLGDPREEQDKIGKFIEIAINEKYERESN